MAVLGGTRVRSSALSTVHASTGRPRVVTPAPARPAPRVRPIGLFMGGIVAATMLGLVYLTQTLGANATDSEVRMLSVESAQLEDRLRRQAVWVQTFTDADEVSERAKDLGLRRLGDVLVLPTP